MPPLEVKQQTMQEIDKSTETLLDGLYNLPDDLQFEIIKRLHAGSSRGRPKWKYDPATRELSISHDYHSWSEALLKSQVMNKMFGSAQFTIHESEDDNDRSQLGASREIFGEMEDLLDRSKSFAVRKVDNHCSSTSSSNSSHGKLDVEELEMLLEAYLVQIDGTVNKLSALHEYVGDTEDYISIMLDDKQKHLLQMGVLLTTTTLVVSAFIVVSGLFGMNISIPLFSAETTNTATFSWVVGGSVVGCAVIYVASMAWCKYKGLIE